MRRINIYCIVIAALLAWSPLSAQEWNYPSPEADRDVTDISFYQPCAAQPLPKITADRPSRIILCIGDGMGFNHITLARWRAVGRTGRLHMERLPVRGVLRTYSANSPVTDSGAAATAIACGIKTNNGMIGVSPDGQPRLSILERLDRKGWRTGLVVTCAVTDATPAAFCTHVDHRRMEEEIAAQMLAGGADVLFGGGRALWTGRKDGRDLITEAQANGTQVIFSREQMQSLQAAPVLGLFAQNGMSTYAPEPTLGQMTQKAIELLSAKSNTWFAPEPRFFLMIEGSQIDWAAQDNNTDNMVRQLLLFDMAVREVIDFAAKDKKTLVIVTADHETGGLTLGGNAEKFELRAQWTGKGHTAADVPLFAYGPGAEQLAGSLDNTEPFRILARLTGLDETSLPVRPQEKLNAHAE